MSPVRVVAWVLFPLLALVTLGFWWTGRVQVPAAAPPPEPPALPVTPTVPLRPQPIAPAPPDAGPADFPPEPSPHRLAVEAIKPGLRQCFLDHGERYPGPLHLQLSFGLVPDGQASRVAEVALVHSTVQDPWLEACILDALTEVQVATETSPLRFTLSFVFQSTDGGVLTEVD